MEEGQMNKTFLIEEREINQDFNDRFHYRLEEEEENKP